MNDLLLQQGAVHLPKHACYIHELLDRYEQIVSQHKLENPDLYRMVEEKKFILSKKINETEAMVQPVLLSQAEDKGTPPKSLESTYFKQYSQNQLINKISENQKLIHEHIATAQSEIIPRTQARNVKEPHDSIEAMTADRADKLESQIKA